MLCMLNRRYASVQMSKYKYMFSHTTCTVAVLLNEVWVPCKSVVASTGCISFQLQHTNDICILWPKLSVGSFIRQSLQNLNDLDFDFSRSPKVRWDGVIGFHIFDFLLVFNTNSLTCGLTWLLYEIQAFKVWVALYLTSKVTQDQIWWCSWTFHMISYLCLIVNLYKLWSKLALLRDTTLQNMSDLDFDL